jgi:hypothetical protein
MLLIMINSTVSAQHIVKDDYNEEKLRNDPAVLVSSIRKPMTEAPRESEIAKVITATGDLYIAQAPRPTQPVRVFTQLCDEEMQNCGEVVEVKQK